MSMIGKYRQVTPHELALLRQNPGLVVQFLYGDAANESLSDRTLDIDKTWHTIHFLLTGDAWEGVLPLRNAVLGGSPLGDIDVGYGPARFLLPEEVRDTAAALTNLPFATLEQRFNLGELAAAQIYPSVWDNRHRDDELAYLKPNYEALVQFFAQAAEGDNAMLLYIT
ncbi:YfbM family protein [Candidatus Gracilibacteria bacterium]|nr:YfbM family protein [Candidatus Gracilibacteria bacterium]